MGYHVQTDNKDNFLSTDFGLKEFNVKSEKERIRLYRKYVYETVLFVFEERSAAHLIGLAEIKTKCAIKETQVCRNC